MVASPKIAGTGTVDEDLLTAARVARAQANALFHDSAGQSADSVKDLLKVKSPILMNMDPGFRVELAMLECMVGDKAESRLRAALLDCLPCAARSIATDVALRKVHAVTKSDLYKYASRSAQGQAIALQRCLAKIVDGKPPTTSMAEYASCQFMSAVVSRLPFFLRATVTDDEGDDKEIFGSDYLAARYLEIKEKHDNGIATLDDCTIFEVFEHLVPADTAEVVTALIKALVENVAGKSSKAEPKKPAKTAQDSAASDPAVQCALDMFK